MFYDSILAVTLKILKRVYYFNYYFTIFLLYFALKLIQRNPLGIHIVIYYHWHKINFKEYISWRYCDCLKMLLLSLKCQTIVSILSFFSFSLDDLLFDELFPFSLINRFRTIATFLRTFSVNLDYYGSSVYRIIIQKTMN